MIHKRAVKEHIKENGYKISKNALEELDKKLLSELDKIIKYALRNAKLSGRKIIRLEDINYGLNSGY
ncbi:hypothetical protein J4463_03665 [Candidatus Pacearchaeota archaeon]|nr:hypothetical protein [Candidatus Pacearchaeota archaeon]